MCGRSAKRGHSGQQPRHHVATPAITARHHRIGAPTASGGFEAAQQKGLRERISPICTLSQNGYGALGLTCIISLPPCPARAAGLHSSRAELEAPAAKKNDTICCWPAASTPLPLGLHSLEDAYSTANTAYEAASCGAVVPNMLRLFSAQATNVEGPCRFILAEGAIALSVTLSGGALFAS